MEKCILCYCHTELTLQYKNSSFFIYIDYLVRIELMSHCKLCNKEKHDQEPNCYIYINIYIGLCFQSLQLSDENGETCV